MRFEDLPTMGRVYGSGEAITELFDIIDEILTTDPARCDCDSYYRCASCRIESELIYKKALLKKKIQEYIDSIDKINRKRVIEDGKK